MAETATTAPAAAQPWVVPASYAQERVWFASQFAAGTPVYHVDYRVRLPYPLTAEQVTDALAAVVGRHETLRTSFRLDDGALMQVVHPMPAQSALPVHIVDLSGEPAESARERVRELGEQIVAEPLRLDEPPLWRARLVRLGDHGDHGDHGWELLFVAHHTVLDAASCNNLRIELTELCEAAAQGRQPVLPELPIQYGDFAVWQRDRLQGATLAELQAFWCGVLAGLPTVHGLPTDRPRQRDNDFAGSEILFDLPADAAAALPLVARRTGATPFMVMLAAYVATLHRLCGQQDIVVGVPVAGRDLPELQPLIGMFVNMVVLRVPVTGRGSFAQLVERVKAVSVAAWDHQEMPFQRLVELLAARDTGAPPLYQLGFNYLPTTVNSQATTAEVDLMLEVDGQHGRLEYSTALFDESTAREIVDSFLRVVSTVLADPEVAPAELPATPLRAATGMIGTVDTAGTVDTHARRAEPAPAAYVEPRTAAEELVAQVWREVLGVDRVGATDDFFELGGHSLLALRVIVRLSAAVEVDLPIQAFFADTTVAGVAAALERLVAAEIDALSEDEALQQLRSNP
jgi:acyl carrier protein